jgi:uncharacterized OB-fold protein
MEKLQVSDQGEIYSYTTVYDAPKGFESMAPYTIALVKLINGPMVTAQLTDLGDEEVHIGMPVEMVTRRLRDDGERALLVYGFKARPRLVGEK